MILILNGGLNLFKKKSIYLSVRVFDSSAQFTINYNWPISVSKSESIYTILIVSQRSVWIRLRKCITRHVFRIICTYGESAFFFVFFIMNLSLSRSRQSAKNQLNRISGAEYSHASLGCESLCDRINTHWVNINSQFMYMYKCVYTYISESIEPTPISPPRTIWLC